MLAYTTQLLFEWMGSFTANRQRDHMSWIWFDDRI